MRIAVSGANGFVGSALCPYLERLGHEVFRLVRQPDPQAPNTAPFDWNPHNPHVELTRIAPLDAVVHLAGSNILRRWTPAVKAEIRNSRVEGTTFLVEALGRLHTPPKTLVCASAFGYYGDRGEEIVNEFSSPGTGFLAEVCQSWEAAAQEAEVYGIRVVNARFGLILAEHGGMLKQMLPWFRRGLGAVLGSGKQYLSWVALEDAIRILALLLEREAVSGPVNVMAPEPVRQREFTEVLSRVVGSPVILREPAGLIRFFAREMGEELLLSSIRAVPTKLQEVEHYPYLYPSLVAALRHTVKEKSIRFEPLPA